MFGSKQKISVEDAVNLIRGWAVQNIDVVAPKLKDDLEAACEGKLDFNEIEHAFVVEMFYATNAGLCHVLKNKTNAKIGDAVWEHLKLKLIEVDPSFAKAVGAYYGCFGIPFAPAQQVLENIGLYEKLDEIMKQAYVATLYSSIIELSAKPWENTLHKMKITL